MMSHHLNEDQLVLHYYGETRDEEIESHLTACEGCRTHYRTLQSVLNVVDSYPVPDRGPEYGAQVWQRLQTGLPRRSPGWFSLAWFPRPAQWAAAGAMVVLLLGAAFYAGRLSTNTPGRRPVAIASQGFDQRVLLSAVGNHLDRTQLILVELANTSDLRPQEDDIHDLLDANRLYRASADQAGERAVADVLDELERLLVEVAHLAPSLTPDAASELRERIMSQGILFRVKVTGSEVREREKQITSLKETTL